MSCDDLFYAPPFPRLVDVVYAALTTRDLFRARLSLRSLSGGPGKTVSPKWLVPTFCLLKAVCLLALAALAGQATEGCQKDVAP